MADEKISAMTAATNTAPADLVPIVQGGTNKKATRTILLTGDGSGNLAIQQSGGFVDVAADGSLSMLAPAGKTIVLAQGSIIVVEVLATGDVTIDAAAGNKVYIGYSAGQTVIGAVANTTTVQGSQVDVTCTNQISGDWASFPPGLVRQAIQRLAAAVKALRGGSPIP